MLAERARARAAAFRRNVQPTQNCTGVAVASAAHRAHGWSAKPITSTSVAMASGQPARLRGAQ